MVGPHYLHSDARRGPGGWAGFWPTSVPAVVPGVCLFGVSLAEATDDGLIRQPSPQPTPKNPKGLPGVCWAPATCGKESIGGVVVKNIHRLRASGNFSIGWPIQVFVTASGTEVA